MAKSNNKPTHNVFLLPTSGQGDWTEVGAGWQNRDGSVTFVLRMGLPKGARVQLRQRRQSLEALAAERAVELEAEFEAKRRLARTAHNRDRSPAPATPASTEVVRGGGVHVL